MLISNRLLATGIIAGTLLLMACKENTAKLTPKVEKDKVALTEVGSVDTPAVTTASSVLTTELLDKTADDDALVNLVYTDIINKLPEDDAAYYVAVKKLSKPRQAIYLVHRLEDEVNNGGFNQYYYNYTGQYASLTPDALKLVGADQFAALAKAANKLYTKEKEKITKKQDGSSEGFSESYKDNPLNDLDDVFFDMDKKTPLLKIVAAYIRKNKALFVTE